MNGQTGQLFQPGPPPGWAGGEVTPSSEWCQRWRDHGHTWRHRAQGGFDRARHDVAPLDKGSAQRFVVAHHYLASWPQAQRCFGLYRDGLLAGAAVFGVPSNGATHRNVFPGLDPYREVTSLARLVCLDEVESNGETFFVSRCFKLLAAEGWAGVVSMADPTPRTTAGGELVFPGHVGTVYQATAGAAYLGRATPRTLLVLPDGQVVNERSLQKARTGERGAGGMERFLVDHGASSLRFGQDRRTWLTSALDEVGVRRQRSRGCHRYAWSLCAHKRAAIAIPGGPWPKAID